MSKNVFGCLIAALLALQPALASESDLTERLAIASPESGEKVFRKCKACHTVEEGGKNRSGPNLWSVVGREVATADGYENYTEAMQAYGGIWSPERLDAFLERPREEVKGTRMGFAGLRRGNERADLIAYLNQNSSSPEVFAAEGDDHGRPVDDQAPDIGVLFAAKGGEETYAYCSACHSERIVVQQGLTRENWEELLEWMVDEQGMSPIDEPDLSLVLDYLAINYGIDRPNFPNN